jgi:hypothetical protein
LQLGAHAFDIQVGRPHYIGYREFVQPQGVMSHVEFDLASPRHSLCLLYR